MEINALTIDFEDWFCAKNLSSVILYENWKSCELRIAENTKRLLDVFDKNKVKATFFVLGWIAERVPDLVKFIAESGHEIASHGYSHISISILEKSEFEKDIRKALYIKKEIVKKDIIGYRSPSFSITRNTLWAYKTLSENGFKYDSSVFPVTYHPDYGISDAPLSIYKTFEGIIEVPLSCQNVAGVRIPFGGGGYFRLYPLKISRMLMKLCNKQGRPFVFYLHPWEIDDGQPRLKLPLIKKFRHYFNIKSTLKKFDEILKEFRFSTIKNMLNEK